MKAYALEIKDIFSQDGQTWWCVAVEPIETDLDISFLARSCDNPSEYQAFCLDTYEYVWAPDPEDVRFGRYPFRVKES